MRAQFQIMSQTPIVKKSNLILRIFATEEIGETPSSPCFVKATPTAEINRLIINSIYLFTVSFLDIFAHFLLIVCFMPRPKAVQL